MLFINFWRPVTAIRNSDGLHALTPWRAARLSDLRADEELRRGVALAEERLADLKAVLEDMRAQREDCQSSAGRVLINRRR
jgi:hypothetical protein